MKQLPNSLSKYKTTPEFTELTVPKGLLKDHKTKPGVWGLIVVLEGQIEYTIFEPFNEMILLGPDTPGVVEPTVLHNVRPLGKLRFHVEFYR